MPTPEPLTMQNVIIGAGFRFAQVFEKPDPRGCEYGTFRVSYTHQTGSVYVEYLRDEFRLYALRVPLEHFENWARECT